MYKMKGGLKELLPSMLILGSPYKYLDVLSISGRWRRARGKINMFLYSENPAFCMWDPVRYSVQRKPSALHFSLSLSWVAIKGNPQIHKKVRTQWEVVLFSCTGCSSSQRHFEPPSSLLAADMWLPTHDSWLARRRWNWVGPSRLSCQADRLPGARRPVSHERGSIRRQWLAGGGRVQTLVPRCGQSADPAAQSRHWCWASGWVRTLRSDLCMMHRRLLRAMRA